MRLKSQLLQPLCVERLRTNLSNGYPRINADEDDEDEAGFDEIRMQIRINSLKLFLLYRRNSFAFPRDVQTQFLLFLKLHRLNFQRFTFSFETQPEILDHFSGMIMLERLFSKLMSHEHPFALSEGWVIGNKKCECDTCSNLYSYLYEDSQLNKIHFSDRKSVV